MGVTKKKWEQIYYHNNKNILFICICYKEEHSSFLIIISF